MSKKILVIHGPNLNMLGSREPEHYGTLTLDAINAMLMEHAGLLEVDLEIFQSNHEGEIIEKIQEKTGNVDGIVINPAAYTHTSVAIRDALMLHSVPVIEVHLSNIHKREGFRHKSMLADIVTGQITGLGPKGYIYALDAVVTAANKSA